MNSFELAEAFTKRGQLLEEIQRLTGKLEGCREALAAVDEGIREALVGHELVTPPGPTLSPFGGLTEEELEGLKALHEETMPGGQGWLFNSGIGSLFVYHDGGGA